MGVYQRDSSIENKFRVSAFRIGIYEITRSQFLSIMGFDPSYKKYSSGMDDPVQNVNWYHAISFCNKLSLKENLEAVYKVGNIDFSKLKYTDVPIERNIIWDAVEMNKKANGYRLPTESEWQWAAMGSIDDRSKKFSGSDGNNIIDDYAWYYKNSGDVILTDPWNWADVENNKNRTHPVGVKKPNGNGIFDMSGNVWELCWDIYGQYPNGEYTNYLGAESGDQRAYRGGGWHYNASYCSVSFRYIINPDSQQYGVGFRLVRN